VELDALAPLGPGMRTQLEKGIRHPKNYTHATVRWALLASTGQPRTLSEALDHPQW
jgi:hypothetical protein